MRRWLCWALAVASIACSGGVDPVRTAGGGREYEGPGAGDPNNPNDSPVLWTTSRSTLVALCTKACVHIAAADCPSAPIASAANCEIVCISETDNAPIACADEVAGLYACTADAKVVCPITVDPEPLIEGCDDEASELQECLVPGVGCEVSPQTEEVCSSLGLPNFVICSEGIAPPPGCLQVSPIGFCCG